MLNYHELNVLSSNADINSYEIHLYHFIFENITVVETVVLVPSVILVSMVLTLAEVVPSAAVSGPSQVIYCITIIIKITVGN